MSTYLITYLFIDFEIDFLFNYFLEILTHFQFLKKNDPFDKYLHTSSIH